MHEKILGKELIDGDQKMRKVSRLLVFPVLVAIMIAGCSKNPEQNNMVVGPNLSASYVPMAGDAVLSATLNVWITAPTLASNAVSVHRVTAAWEEATVTLNSFAGSYDPAVEGTFVTGASGWRTVDVTTLVAAWSAGTYDNFGVLLKYAEKTFPLTQINSREYWNNHPMLEVCYSTAAGQQCIQYPAVMDTYISKLFPDVNYGSESILVLGFTELTYFEKQDLISFDLPVLPEPASLGDFVWYDDNDNGIQDAGEVGVPNVTVQLMDCAGQVLASTVTNASGYYLFSNLTPGDYNVHFVPELGYVFSPQDQGSDDALDSDVNPVNGMTVCTTLESGENDMTWDAGLYLPPPPQGCSFTIGFWKTHAGFGPQPDHVTKFLPIWLGTAGGSRSINVNNVLIAYNILVMKTYGLPTNGITKLYAQMLAAKLNIANGASGSAIASTISAADAWLANHRWTEWSSLSKSAQKQVLGWLTTFDNYNNGIIGPGHCDIVGDGDGT